MRLLTCSALFLAGLAVLIASGSPSRSQYATGYSPQTTGGAAVVVPYYGATYGGPQGLSAADGKRIVELLESIDRRLEGIEARSAGPLAQRAGPDLLAVAKAHCAACHTPGKAEAKGGGFALFADDGGAALLPLSGRQRTAVKQATADGSMPPSGRKKLTAEEKAAFKW
ncbi:MAG: hypothetical protein E6Q76_19675 [Rhizobium sp.]|nr:MAG: hypothetical protein E6Q76_19675 [Rhizobium sp.]